MNIQVNGQRISQVKPVAKATGAYVRAGGAIYPADAGYPLAVIVDAIAAPGQALLLPSYDGVVVAYGASDRGQVIENTTADALAAAMRRVVLLSCGEVLALEGVNLKAAGLAPEQCRSLDWKILPPVITRAKGVRQGVMFASTMGMLIAGFAFAGSRVIVAADALKKETKAAQTQIATLQKEIAAMNTSSPGVAQIAVKRQPLPSPTEVLSEEIPANAVDIVVKGGRYVSK